MRPLYFAIAAFAAASAQQVEIIGPEDTTLKIELTLQDASSTIKEAVQEALGIPYERQILYFEGDVLCDTQRPGNFPLRRIRIAEADPNSPQMRSENLFRDYYAPVTASEKKDITYIIISLADKSLTSLLTMKLKPNSELNKVGNRIEHIHPLNFLRITFTDEKLKVGIRNIKKRGSWLWKEFIEGLSKSLEEEMIGDNMQEACVRDFCSKVHIDYGITIALIDHHQWHDFVNLLIEKIPRQGDSGRYDI